MQPFFVALLAGLGFVVAYHTYGRWLSYIETDEAREYTVEEWNRWLRQQTLKGDDSGYTIETWLLWIDDQEAAGPVLDGGRGGDSGGSINDGGGSISSSGISSAVRQRS